MEVRCFDDLDEIGFEITNPLEELEQDNFHRLIEDPGSNPDDDDRGLGLPAILSGDASAMVSLGPRIEAELRKDARNASVRATITEVGAREYACTIEIEPDADELGVNPADLGTLIMQLRMNANGDVWREPS